MLEKIGLPPKPSLRGNNWVIDASHCQGCSSQFTFLNRKHHCRRCGGIFCNSCTQYRLMLRGQGDSPVRICEPCKKLEEAARFELRHGSKSRVGKGGSKAASRSVDEALNQILTDSVKGTADGDEETDIAGNASDGVHSDTTTPEELRQQSVEERNRYKSLKGEGKSAEALKAFKRAKELERQAAAMELQLRKSRKKSLASSSEVESLKSENASFESDRREQPTIQKGKGKDDLTAELRELGWSDVDIHDAEKKPAATSLEGELLSLIGNGSRQTTGGSKSTNSSVDKSKVVALKKNALMLKREGKLAEAKEELKKAKILEKQLEEQEFLAEAEDSDDELSALVRSLDNDTHKDFSNGLDLESGFDFGNLSSIGGDIGLDGIELTDDDLHDPEIAAALQSLGWTEDPVQPDERMPPSVSVDKVGVEAEILKLKREALTQKRSGNMAGAKSLLTKAKDLEKGLNGLDVDVPLLDSFVSGGDQIASGFGQRNETFAVAGRKPASKSRLQIQKELLALKKKALSLRREGKVEEADEELMKGKVLEQQLEELDNPVKSRSQTVDDEIPELEDKQLDLSTVLNSTDEEADVTDQDLHDPTYLSLLDNLGWQDSDHRPIISSSEVSVGNERTPVTATIRKPKRSKADMQRELLGLKRKALTLRRQGQDSEAEEVLQSAKVLEEQLAEIEAPRRQVLGDFSEHETEVESKSLKQENVPEINLLMETGPTQTPLKRPAVVNDDTEKRQAVEAAGHEANFYQSVSPDSQKSSPQQEILAHKRKALALKREGKLAEAREELRKAKLLERNLGDGETQDLVGPVAMDSSRISASLTAREEKTPSPSKTQEEQDPPNSSRKPLSSHERYKLQRECLNHKRNALKLRREGKTEEADALHELAKKLEAQLEEASLHNDATPTASDIGSDDKAIVEDFLDPQLLSALNAIGLQEPLVVAHTPAKVEPSSSVARKNESSSQETVQLEMQIKAEKVKALNLKRAGRQAEALEALRRAKQMEKKLNALV